MLLRKYAALQESLKAVALNNSSCFPLKRTHFSIVVWVSILYLYAIKQFGATQRQSMLPGI